MGQALVLGTRQRPVDPTGVVPGYKRYMRRLEPASTDPPATLDQVAVILPSPCPAACLESNANTVY